MIDINFNMFFFGWGLGGCIQKEVANKLEGGSFCGRINIKKDGHMENVGGFASLAL